MTSSKRQDLVILGRAIRVVREQHGVTAQELASAADVPRARIVALESGAIDPDYELLLALAERIGVRPSAFILQAEALGGPGTSAA